MAERPWSLRATVTIGDSTKAALSIGVVPAAAANLTTILDSWKLGVKKEDELVPTLATVVTEKGPGQADWKDSHSVRLRMLPQEAEGEGVGMGLLPVLDMALEDNRWVLSMCMPNQQVDSL